MDAIEIEQLLYNSALARAITYGFRLGRGADDDIRNHARRVSLDISLNTNIETSPPEKLIDAVRAFQLLVDMMINVRKEAYRGRPDLLSDSVIGEDTLQLTFNKVCPGLWPFC